VFADRPNSVSELPASSVYYSLFDEDAAQLKFQWEDQGGAVTTDVDGNLVYFCYRVNPTLGYVPIGAALDGKRPPHCGEFLEITFPDGSGRDPIYVHYSQVYQPTEAARLETDLLTIVMGILHGASRLQIAKMEDLLVEADMLNMHMAKLIELHRLFSGLQDQFCPDEAHNKIIALKWDVLVEFRRAGIPLPFKWAMVGALPRIFLLYNARNSLCRHTRWSVHCMDISFVDKDKKERKKRLLAESGKIYYNKKKGRPRGYADVEDADKFDLSPENVYRLVCENSPYGDPTSYFDAASCRSNGSDGSMSTSTIGGLVDTGEAFTLKPEFDEETGAILRYSLVPEDVIKGTRSRPTVTIANNWTPILKPAQEIERGQHSIYVSGDDLKRFCDFIRMHNDAYTARMSNISTMILLNSNELQQSLSAAVSLVQKIGNVHRRVAANTHY
jgi:hypothetical protein